MNSLWGLDNPHINDGITIETIINMDTSLHFKDHGYSDGELIEKKADHRFVLAMALTNKYSPLWLK